MKNSTRIILIILCVLLIAASIAGIVFAFVNKFDKKAYADEIETQEKFVNFNQLINYDDITTTNDFRFYNDRILILTSGTTFETFSGVRVNLDLTHRYYIYVDSDCNAFPELYSSQLDLSYNIDETQIFTPGGTGSFALYLRRRVSSDIGYLKTYIIDLDLMFGSDVSNDLTLIKCNELFIADFYSYTLGETVALDTFTAYSQGMQEIYSKLYYEMSFQNIMTNVQTYQPSDHRSDSTITRNDPNGVPYAYMLKFHGAVYIPFLTELPQNSAVTINMTYAWGYLSSTDLKTDVYFMDVNGNLQYITHWGELYDDPPIADRIIDPKSFTYYTNSNAVGLVLDSTDASFEDVQIQGLSINFRTSDISVLLENSKVEIEALIRKEYETYYSEGGAGYQTIYSKGFEMGLNTSGDAAIGTMQYIGAAFKGIGDILQIELLPGIPISLFLLLPLMISLIFFVVKLSKGGG